MCRALFSIQRTSWGPEDELRAVSRILAAADGGRRTIAGAGILVGTSGKVFDGRRLEAPISDSAPVIIAALDDQGEVDATALATKLKISEASAIHLVAHLASKGKVSLSIRATGKGEP
jgi:hypothetical protein